MMLVRCWELPIQRWELAMEPSELVTMNMRELDRLKVIQAVMDKMLKPGLAAERLHLTVRQIERLVFRYKQAGAAGVGLSGCALPSCLRSADVAAATSLADGDGVGVDGLVVADETGDPPQ